MNFNELYPKKKEYYYLLRNIKTTAECNSVNCIIDKQKAKLLMRYINKKEKEIKRLNYKLQQKENIIKEVREKIRYWQQDYMGTYISTDELDEILEILDKDII